MLIGQKSLTKQLPMQMTGSFPSLKFFTKLLVLGQKTSRQTRVLTGRRLKTYLQILVDGSVR